MSAGAFVWPLRVYWEDTDAGGIVFYANYLKFFERARTEWLRTLGVEQQSLRERSGGIFVVTDTRLRYHRPALLDDLLHVTAERVDIGAATLTIAQRASRGDALLCEGTIRIAWVHAGTLRPARIPSDLRKLLS